MSQLCAFRSTSAMEVSAGTKLKQEFSSNYKSFENPSELSDDGSTNGFTCDLNKNRGERGQFR